VAIHPSHRFQTALGSEIARAVEATRAECEAQFERAEATIRETAAREARDALRGDVERTMRRKLLEKMRPAVRDEIEQFECKRQTDGGHFVFCFC
jgi:phosphoenolpyruvate carboxylase